jgi:hypothetical protein
MSSLHHHQREFLCWVWFTREIFVTLHALALGLNLMELHEVK